MEQKNLKNEREIKAKELLYVDGKNEYTISVDGELELEERRFARLEKYVIDYNYIQKVQQQQLISFKCHVSGKWEISDDECNIVF